MGVGEPQVQKQEGGIRVDRVKRRANWHKKPRPAKGDAGDEQNPNATEVDEKNVALVAA